MKLLPHTPGLVGGDDAWAAAFEALSAEGLVKTSLGLEQRSLDDRLLDVQETYDFSAGSGYREGKPDEDEGARDLDEGKEGVREKTRLCGGRLLVV
ncbi:unnamed protein product [Ectocarpus fasciculatus]